MLTSFVVNHYSLGHLLISRDLGQFYSLDSREGRTHTLTHEIHFHLFLLLAFGSQIMQYEFGCLILICKLSIYTYLYI